MFVNTSSIVRYKQGCREYTVSFLEWVGIMNVSPLVAI